MTAAKNQVLNYQAKVLPFSPAPATYGHWLGLGSPSSYDDIVSNIHFGKRLLLTNLMCATCFARKLLQDKAHTYLSRSRREGVLILKVLG